MCAQPGLRVARCGRGVDQTANHFSGRGPVRAHCDRTQMGCTEESMALVFCSSLWRSGCGFSSHFDRNRIWSKSRLATQQIAAMAANRVLAYAVGFRDQFALVPALFVAASFLFFLLISAEPRIQEGPVPGLGAGGFNRALVFAALRPALSLLHATGVDHWPTRLSGV